VTNKREPSVLTDQSCHRGEARCCGLTLYPQQFNHGAVIEKSLKQLFHYLEVLPVSSADCEWGFSQMNLHHFSG